MRNFIKYKEKHYGLYQTNKAPYNSRELDKLLKEQHGTDAVSSSTLPGLTERNVKLAGQRHPVTGIVFDQKGFPIFDDVVMFDTRLSQTVSLGAKSRVHKEVATKSLAEAIKSDPLLRSKFDAVQLRDIISGEKTITGYIWHHHQDIGRMQLVPRLIHETTGHTGEKIWIRGLDGSK